MYARAAKKGASERESELVSRVRGEGEGGEKPGRAPARGGVVKHFTAPMM
jgi:hypothetical protein